MAHRAEAAWEIDRRVAVEELALKLAKAPELVSRRLRQSAPGCAWLIERWTLLERVLPGPSVRDERLASVAVVAAVLAEYERARHAAPPIDTRPDAGAWRAGARLGWQRPVGS